MSFHKIFPEISWFFFPTWFVMSCEFFAGAVWLFQLTALMCRFSASFCQPRHGSSRSLWPPYSCPPFQKALFLFPAPSLMGENHPSHLPKQPGHPMISDSFSSNISVAHTMSNGCACLLLCMCRHMWGNVCTCYKHCISSCKQQAIKPTSPEPPRFSWTM